MTRVPRAVRQGENAGEVDTKTTNTYRAYFAVLVNKMAMAYSEYTTLPTSGNNNRIGRFWDEATKE
eukprot:12755210-Prorocentrum_lima.AAC.1